METDAVEAFRGLMFRYRAIGSVSHAISVRMCACVSIICTFGLILHTLIWPQHIYPVFVHRTHSLFSRETNHYGFSAVDVEEHHRSKCACVFGLFRNESDGIFLFHVTAKRLHNCACTPGLDLQCCNFGLSVLSISKVKFIRNGKFCHFLTLVSFQAFSFLQNTNWDV